MNEIIEFRKNLITVFKSPAGRDVLKFLEQAYVDSTAIGSNTEHTYYKLGQKEFVQGFIKDATMELSDLEKESQNTI